uniref:ATP synthase epsilon chain, chloroplastic n=1 Tax=Marsupiomonas sp. NIES 1824 TaxID=1562198 RepID=A0A097KLR6_9CHLO|nr:CF1 epsilon subunit of ATP synthase [Marsupiomonas sp. NIES 1824]
MTVNSNRSIKKSMLSKPIMSLKVCIMTPDQIFWNKEVEEIILPTNTGQMGVLTNHAPVITALDIGVMSIRTKNEWSPVALMGGFALVKQNQVTVLVNEAESIEDIDVELVEQLYTEAREKLESAATEKEKVEANSIFKRAKARYQMVKQEGLPS